VLVKTFMYCYLDPVWWSIASMADEQRKLMAAFVITTANQDRLTSNLMREYLASEMERVQPDIP